MRAWRHPHMSTIDLTKPVIILADALVIPKGAYTKLTKHLPLDIGLEMVAEFHRHNGSDVMFVPFTGHNMAHVLMALSTMGHEFAWNIMTEWRELNWVTGSWDCEQSPWKKCVFDHENDRSHDFCIYCGLPDERK